MSEEVAATPQTDEQPQVPAQEPDWKAMARKWEERAKANSEAAERLAQLEESQKTEAQKAAERLAALEGEVAQYRTKEQVRAWAEEVAKVKGVAASALRGDTREELEAHADEIKSLIEAAQPVKTNALAPYVPSEGSSPAGNLAGNAQLFADAIRPALNL